MNTYFGVAAGPYVVARTRRGLGKREGRTSSCGREPTVDGQPGPGRVEHETEFQEQYLNHSSVSPPRRRAACYYADRNGSEIIISPVAATVLRDGRRGVLVVK